MTQEYEEIWNQACRETLLEIKKAFTNKIHMVDNEYARAVLGVLAANIETFPIPPYPNKPCTAPQ